MPFETAYPSKTSFQQAIDLALLDPNGDALEYMGEVLDEFPKNIQADSGFQKFKHDTRALADSVREENEISTDALYAGDDRGLESGKEKIRDRIINQSIDNIKDDIILFHYAIEDNTTKIASGYQTLEGEILSHQDAKSQSVTMLFHLWLKDNNFTRKDDTVYVKGSNKVVNSAELKNLIQDEEKGFSKYLENNGINNIIPFEKEYVITAPQEAQKTTKVDEGVELSPEEQTKGISSKTGG